jgi:GT2 family glycosyltransferase
MREDLLPFVRVIIPVYEDWERLNICLEALDEQTYPADNFEVVVVDNGSNTVPVPGSYKFPLSVKVCQKPGSYAARNLGLSGSHADIFAFTDADCIPEPGWIENGVKVLQEPRHSYDLAAGRIKLFAKNTTQPTAAELFELSLEFDQERSVKRKGSAVTANLFVSQNAMQKLGGFDENLKSGGDIDFTKRGRIAGFSIIYVKDAVVQHPARTSLKELYKKSRRKAGGDIDKRQGWGKVLYLISIAKPPIRKAIRIMRTEDLSVIERIRAIGVLCMVRAAESHEWFNIVVRRKPSIRR